ncbi:hypothetical protein D3C75_916040 [compost metagenome]
MRQRVEQGFALLAIHFKPQIAVYLGQGTQLQISLGERGQVPEVRLLSLAEHAWVRVEHAQRADGFAVAGAQGVAGVKADVGRVEHQRVVDESPVALGVGHHQGTLTENGVAAKGNTARRLACLKPYAGLEPLSVLVDQADKHSIHMGQVLGKPHQGIEVMLGWCIDQVHVIERALAKRFVCG